MKKLLIEGGRPLHGTVAIHGAKNSVLPILAACALIPEPVRISNCPDISDVATAAEILKSLGCDTGQAAHTVTVDASGLNRTAIPRPLMEQMRSSVLFLGALLAARGACSFSLPGGCVLGSRPIDMHLRALEQMGAEIVMEGERFHCSAKRLHGASICLPYPSVGATENILLAAMGTDEPVTIIRAAREPEIVDLAAFLRAAGAEITGAGTDLIRIRGGSLHGIDHSVIPDRIEAATYLACCACSGGAITLTNCEPPHLQPFLDALAGSGCHIQSDEHTITCAVSGRLRASEPIRTAPYPAFPTDAQPLLMACMTAAEGDTVFAETVFTSRFRHVPALRQMGASILAGRQIAVVRGVERLHGAVVEATDLRGGAALTAAALGAEGTTELTNLQHIARGYDSLTENLKSLGAEIICIDIPPREEYYESERKNRASASQG